MVPVDTGRVICVVEGGQRAPGRGREELTSRAENKGPV